MMAAGGVVDQADASAKTPEPFRLHRRERIKGGFLTAGGLVFHQFRQVVEHRRSPGIHPVQEIGAVHLGSDFSQWRVRPTGPTDVG